MLEPDLWGRSPTFLVLGEPKAARKQKDGTHTLRHARDRDRNANEGGEQAREGISAGDCEKTPEPAQEAPQRFEPRDLRTQERDLRTQDQAGSN